MGCVLCNITDMRPDINAFFCKTAEEKQEFLDELANDIATRHPEMVEKINGMMEHKLRDSMYQELLSKGIIDSSIPKEHYSLEHLWNRAKGHLGGVGQNKGS